MQIALRISGTKVRQAGFSPLVNIGLLPGEIGDNMDRSFAFMDSPAYVLRHGNDYLAYMLVDRKVRSFDAEASGILSIALTISSDACLADEKSPYTLLKEVYETFREQFMTPLADGRYCFINQEIDDTVFREIVQKYPLATRIGPFVRMLETQAPVGVLQVAEDNMEVFFRDTQYKEFGKYSEIQIGATCQSYPGLDSLEIPRRPEYEVVVNGKKTGASLKDPNEVYQASDRGSSYTEYTPTSFMLGELLSSPDGQLEREGAVIRLDREKAQIICTLQKQDVFYSVKVNTENLSEEARKILVEEAKEGIITLSFGNEDLTAQLYHPTPVSISYSTCQRYQPSLKEKKGNASYSFNASRTLEQEARKMIINVRAVKKNATYFQGGSSGPSSSSQHDQNRKSPDPDPISEQKPTPSDNRRFSRKQVLAFGAAAGFVLGALLMWGLMSPLGYKKIPSDSELIEKKALKEKEDSLKLLQVKDDIIHNLEEEKKGLTDQINQLKEALSKAGRKPIQIQTPTQTPTPNPVVTTNNRSASNSSDDSLKDILAAVNNQKSLINIKNMNGYGSLTVKRRQALGWICETRSNCQEHKRGQYKGKFVGNPNYDHDKTKARAILDLTKEEQKKGWTWDSIDAYYVKVDNILKGN